MLKSTIIPKRLINYSLYPPTMYFPISVPEALIIEPAETKRNLDDFCDAMIERALEAVVDITILKKVPTTAACIVRRGGCGTADAPEIRRSEVWRAAWGCSSCHRRTVILVSCQMQVC